MASTRTSAPAAPPMTTPPVLTEREPTKEEVVTVPRTKPEDVLQGFEAKSLTIIDVRDADSYKERHIPGALHIPLAYIAGEIPYLPKDKPIVTYCT
ncbi:MAG TPA: rhodanese-like domain-containing protein [Thermoanaerobaculia bacterium]|nr:rhodanese-like domain-containing protein [Thermoanaerobaculia bacterium]